jgi:hypothetical protein
MRGILARELIGENMIRAIFSGVSVVFICLVFCKSAIYGQTIKVTLLGTGCPTPVMNRFGPSILVEAGDQKLIFDVGRGALLRLTPVKVRPNDINGVFFTHLHSDHLVGFPDLWLTGWGNGRRENNKLNDFKIIKEFGSSFGNLIAPAAFKRKNWRKPR